MKQTSHYLSLLTKGLNGAHLIPVDHRSMIPFSFAKPASRIGNQHCKEHMFGRA